MIAGVATSDELETLSRQVSQAMAASSSGTRELQRQADKLASISQLTNKRIDISNAKINDIREQLQGFAVTTRVSLVSANNLMLFMVKQLFLSQLAMTHSETLFTALKDVANGILPPEIVTPRQLTKTIREIEKVLKQKYPNFEILVKKNFYYYSESKVHAVRLNETILIKVMFTLSSLDLRFNLYEVIQTRSITFNGKHSSFMADLPKYVAVGYRRKYTINYQSRPEIAHDSIKLGNSKLEESSDSCMMAIIENNSSKVHNYCKTVLFKEPVDTEIVRLTGSSMILANVERYTLYCSNGSWIYNITGCQFCTVQVPCDCNILTSKVLLPANLEDCTDSDKVRQQHLIDLNTLLHFFNESDLQTILGDTLLPHPINVTLPIFKLHDDKSRVEPDEEIKKEPQTSR